MPLPPILCSLLAALGLTSACVPASTEPHAAPAGLRCALEITEAGGLTRVAAWAESPRPVAGTYDLSLSGGGASIRQGGSFALDAGARKTLGQARLSVAPAALRGGLTLTAEGRTLSCPRIP